MTDTIEIDIPKTAEERATRALARREERNQSVVAREPSEDQSLLATINRIAADPNVNIERLSKVMDLYERVKNDRARTAYNSAFAEMQPSLPTINESGEYKLREGAAAITYAKQADIVEAIRPTLGAHGFGISHRNGQQTDKTVTVIGILRHKDGYCEETPVTLPHDSSGSKNAAQSVKSAISYGIRITTIMLCGIASRAKQDGDDDAAMSGYGDTVTDEQAEEIRDLLTKTKSNLDLFLKYVGAPSVSDIPVGKYKDVVAKLKAKLGRAA